MLNKKAVLILCILSIFGSPIFAEKIKKEKVTQEDRDKLILSLNYIEYSVAQISEYKNKEVADSEFNFTINKISPESFLDTAISNEWDRLSQMHSNIALKENEREFIKKQSEKKRKQAFTSAFKSYGSVFVPGATPQQMIASLAYTTASAAMNYMDTVNEIDNSMQKEFFNIDQSELEVIQTQKRNITSTANKLSFVYGLDWDKVIRSEEMEPFVRTLKGTAQEKISGLDVKEFRDTFGLFPPFWYELGNAHQELGNYKKADECYDYFEKLMVYRVLKNDKQYVQVAKNRILILLGEDSSFENMSVSARKNRAQIEKYIQIINDNTPRNIYDFICNNYFFSKIYYLLGDKSTALSCLQYILDNKTHGTDYIDDSVLLMRLILESDKSSNGDIYRLTNYYSQVVFGESSDSAEALQIQLARKEGGVNRLLGKLPNVISSHFNDNIGLGEYDISQVPNYVDTKHFYLELPEIISEDSLCLLKINDKQYIPVKIVPNDFESTIFDDLLKNYEITLSPEEYEVMKQYILDNKDLNEIYYFDYEINQIEESPVKMFMNIYNSKTKAEYEICYKIQKLSNKDMNKVEESFARIGTDMSSVNVDVLLEYMKLIKKYEYKVKDIDNEKKAITKKLNKENKKNNNPMSTYRFNQEVLNRLSESLEPDNKKLNEFLNEATLAVYAGQLEDIPYSTSIVKYGEDIYAVSLISVDNQKNTYVIGSNGEIIKKQNPVNMVHDKDINIIYQKARMGDAASQFEYGRRLYEGIGISVNYVEALKWLYRAADKGYNEAYKYLGNAYLEGNGVTVNKEAAKVWYFKAAENGITIDSKLIK